MIPSNDNPHGYRHFEGGFPDSYRGATFKTDFRVWLRYRTLTKRKDISKSRMIDASIRLCYKAVPEELQVITLIEGIHWFYQCGEADRIELLRLNKKVYEGLEAEREKQEAKAEAFDYFWDFKEVWASFKAAYNIDLYVVDLHWWAFHGLMSGFGSESPLAKLYQVRTLEYKNKPSASEVLAHKLAALPDEY
jgi:hypothetical protein